MMCVRMYVSFTTCARLTGTARRSCKAFSISYTLLAKPTAPNTYAVSSERPATCTRPRMLCRSVRRTRKATPNHEQSPEII